MKRFKHTLLSALASLGDSIHTILFRHMTRTGLVLRAADDDGIRTALEHIRAEVKGPIEELRAQVADLEQKGARRGGGGGKSDTLDLAKILEDSAGFASLKSKNTPKCSIPLPPTFFSKAALTSTTAAVTAVVDPMKLPGIIIQGQRRMTIRDLLPVLPTEQGSVEYVREVSFTNSATPVAEGALKPQSTPTLELMTAKIITIAHWAHASKQILDDVPQLQNYLDNRLRYGLQYVEELQLLMGSGTGENLNGLYTQATAYAAPFTYASPTSLDMLRLAIGQIENSNYRASAIVLNPDDWTRIELMKTTDTAYLLANPKENGARVLWGLPVVTTAAMTIDKFLVGDFPTAAILFDRQEPTLDIAFTDQDDFVRNLVKLRVEERVGLAVTLPGALVKGDFGLVA